MTYKPEFPDLRNVYDLSVKGHYGTDAYIFFWAGPFSNWHPARFIMPVGDGNAQWFNCSEQAMMYLKAKVFNDTDAMDAILHEPDPAKQKAVGRAIKGYDEAVWSAAREKISDDFLLRKFAQNEDLLRVLIDTGSRHIVEASPYDNVWGIAMGADKYPEILDPANWKGQNLLGESLMRVRSQLQHTAVLLEFKREAELASSTKAEKTFDYSKAVELAKRLNLKD